jgi:hypothetical protein
MKDHTVFRIYIFHGRPTNVFNILIQVTLPNSLSSSWQFSKLLHPFPPKKNPAVSIRLVSLTFYAYYPYACNDVLDFFCASEIEISLYVRIFLVKLILTQALKKPLFFKQSEF